VIDSDYGCLTWITGKVTHLGYTIFSELELERVALPEAEAIVFGAFWHVFVKYVTEFCRGHKKKKALEFLKPLQSFRLFFHYCMLVVSLATLSAAGSSTAGASSVISVFSVDSSVDSVFPPPQATKLKAKPHTINNAINFFIVYRFLRFGGKYTRIGIE